MKLSEAYSILDLPQNSNLEDCKKRYKLLAKQYHPDINPDPKAAQKMQEINDAWNQIQKGPEPEPQSFPSSWGSHFHRQQVQLEHIEVNLTIDFKESVLGCKKDIKYMRNSKCQSCNGDGQIKVNNGCKECNGRGQITKQQRGMVIVSTCPKCFGKSNVIDCSACQGEGSTKAETSVQVSVPAGVFDGSALRLQNMGHYAGTMMGFMESHTDVFCHITVLPEEGLAIEGKSVITTLPLTLLDALKGCQRKVKTIFGDREITIPPTSRHKEEVIIPNCGVNATGDQRVILDIAYPTDPNQLIALLEGQYIIPIISNIGEK